MGSTFERGLLMAVPMASVGNSVVKEEAGGLPGEEEKFSGPLFVKGGCLPAPADRLPAFSESVL